jgi:hypothetical protein
MASMQFAHDIEKKIEHDHIEHIKGGQNNVNVINQEMIERDKDDAASILREVGHVEYTIEKERKVLRTIDRDP